MSRSATAFAPASVGNIGVGFDLLGHAIDGPRDIATVRAIAQPTVRIEAITGTIAGVDSLPLDPLRNTAGGALLALREALGLPFGFALELRNLLGTEYEEYSEQGGTRIDINSYELGQSASISLSARF